MELLFIRHGEAETPTIVGSFSRRLALIDTYGSGSYRGNLTARGRRQAARVAGLLAERGVDRLFSSPTPRARQTAEPTAQTTGLSIHQTADLKEISAGYLLSHDRRWIRWKMISLLAINSLYTRLCGRAVFIPVALYFIRMYMHGWLNNKTKRGESIASVRSRLTRLLSRIAEETDPAQSVALFSHGYLIYYLINHFLEPEKRAGRMLRKPYVPNGSISRIVKREGGWEVLSYAETGPAVGALGIGGE
jgi:broad specificity phosphatase PhoE